MKPNLLIIHGGGPTAVINCSLYGAVAEAQSYKKFDQILGARGGVQGALHESFVNMNTQSRQALESLKHTPGSALGSCRYKLQEKGDARFLEVLKKYNIHFLLYNGGNGSMAGALQIQQMAQAAGYDLKVIGIPKTVDNDLAQTDRCPGFGSAARYVAQSVRDLGMDIKSLPTPVSIFETMGRGVGWLAGAAALARIDSNSAPHLIYMSERTVTVDQFIGDIDNQMKKTGWVVAVVSEGLCGADGQPIFAHSDKGQLDTMGRSLPGDVGAFLAGEVSKKLGLRCRSEKPGLCGRSSMLLVSPQDQRDAEVVGRAAVRAVADGQTGKMVALLPLLPDGKPQTQLVDLGAVAGKEKCIPKDWIDPQRPWVSQEFINYAQPLIGEALLEYGKLEELKIEN